MSKVAKNALLLLFFYLLSIPLVKTSERNDLREIERARENNIALVMESRFDDNYEVVDKKTGNIYTIDRNKYGDLSFSFKENDSSVIDSDYFGERPEEKKYTVKKGLKFVKEAYIEFYIGLRRMLK